MKIYPNSRFKIQLQQKVNIFCYTTKLNLQLEIKNKVEEAICENKIPKSLALEKVEVNIDYNNQRLLIDIKPLALIKYFEFV